MAGLRFSCPHCDQSLEAPEDMLGETIECPSCNGSIQLPKPDPTPRRQIQTSRRKIVMTRRSAPAHSSAAPTSHAIRKQNPSKKKIAVPASLAAIVLGILYFASPYWGLHQMRRAVESNDAVYISDHVDFPQLRESLKATFKTHMAKEVAKEDADGFEALGAALGAMMIDPMVDAMVTPEGLIAMMQGKDLDEIQNSPKGSSGNPQSPVTTDEQMNVTKMGYEKLNRFVVKVADPSEGPSDKNSLTLLFLRSGLFSWKLAGIRLQIK